MRRLDIVFDIYKTDSLKAATRERGGVGTRRKNSLDTQIPGNRQSFLRDDKNNEEFFGIIAQQVSGIQVEGRAVYCTSGEAVISSCTELEPCSHEEADTRMLCHVLHATEHGHKKITIRTVDTDVVVLAISHVQNIPVDELWIALGNTTDILQHTKLLKH